MKAMKGRHRTNQPWRRETTMKATISRDVNGNSIVRLTFNNARGFSIQTNGNLPETHRTRKPDFAEIRAYVGKYGTHYQKSLIASDTRELYRTAKAVISCAYFKRDDFVSIKFSRIDENGIAWYEVSKDGARSTMYPEHHLTNFCL